MDKHKIIKNQLLEEAWNRLYDQLYTQLGALVRLKHDLEISSELYLGLKNPLRERMECKRD